MPHQPNKQPQQKKGAIKTRAFKRESKQGKNIVPKDKTLKQVGENEAHVFKFSVPLSEM